MEFLADIIDALRDEKRFVRLTLSAPARPGEAVWQKIAVRTVSVAGERRLQAVLQGARKQTTQTIQPAEIARKLSEFLALGFRRAHLQCTDGDLHVRITRKGKALLTRGKPSVEVVPELEHDRPKAYAFPADEPDEFLEAIGLMKNGRVPAAMQDKFRQVNHFIELLSHCRRLEPSAGLRVVDFGCGRAFLTLAVYRWLTAKRGIACRMTGVDESAEVIAAASRLRDAAACDVELIRSRISDYRPAQAPQVVLSLHACDTATDEAIARGVEWGADLILAAPCCQHELHRKIARPEFRALLRHGILRERLADLLTDSLRAAALRAVGYKAEVIEFIAPGDTAKNLMIRAEKVSGIRREEALAEYRALADFWQARPVIEDILGLPQS